MPFIIPVAIAVGAALSAAAAVVIATIAAVVAAVTAAVIAAVSAVASVIAGIAVAVAEFVAGVITTVASAIGAVAEGIGHALTVVWMNVVEEINYWYFTFKDLLEVIHFKVIMEVHNIAMLVSPQYRNMMKQVYSAISEVSDAIGLGPHFLLLALRNSRNLILDLSTTFGSKYDLAEVTWISSLNGFLTHMQTHVDTWENNPEQLLNDLAGLIDKPAMDAKGGFLASVWSTLEAVTGVAATAATDIKKISTDLTELIGGLPAAVRRNIPRELTETLSKVNNIVATEVLPRVTGLERLVTAHTTEQERIRAQVQAAVVKILTPLQTVTALPTLSEAEQQKVSDSLEAISAERRLKLWDLLTDALKPTETEYQRILALKPPAIPPPRLLTLEPGLLAVPSGGPAPSSAGWFVGDF